MSDEEREALLREIERINGPVQTMMKLLTLTAECRRLAKNVAAMRERCADVLQVAIDVHDEEEEYDEASDRFVQTGKHDRERHRGFCECFGVTSLERYQADIRSLPLSPAAGTTGSESPE